jgi:hypothetical protein
VTNQLVGDSNIRVGLSLLNERNLGWLEILHTCLLIPMAVLLIYAFLKSRQDNASPLNVYIAKAFLALLLFTGFFSLLHTTNYILSGCAWYGCSFSVLFVLLMGLIFKKILFVSSPSAKFITVIFFLSLVANSLETTKYLNTAWMLINRKPEMQLDVWLNLAPKKALYQAYRAQREVPNFERTYLAWKNRDDRELAEELLKKTSLETRYYMHRELLHLKTKNAKAIATAIR